MPGEGQLSVLLVSPESAGGIGRHVRMLTDGLLARGIRVTVCAPRGTLERFEFAASGAHLVAAPVGARTGWWRGRGLLRRLAAEHDVTHAHGVRAGALAALAGARPLLVTWHNAPLGAAPRRALHQALERLSARHSALILGASADLVERARRAGARRALLCEVAAPMLSVERSSAPGKLHDPPRVLAVGRLHAQKRLDLLIDVAADWPAGPGRPDFLIAGDGPLAGQLARQAGRQRAPVRLLGARDDMAALLADADILVLCSDWEARPLVAQEALRAGVPLVATDVGGVRDLVGSAALLVPRRDPRALAEALRRVLTDDDLRRRLSVAGPARAASWPTVEEMVAHIVRIYLDLNSSVSSGGSGIARDTPPDPYERRAND